MNPDRPPIKPAVNGGPPDAKLATEHLLFIRDMMARSSSYTVVSGYGLALAGTTAVPAALIAGFQDSQGAWLTIWLVEAAVAAAIAGGFLMRKTRHASVSLASGPGRKYLQTMLPPLAAGLVLTIAAYRGDDVQLLPGLWLLLYGAGTVAAGTFSVREIPYMGILFMLLGGIALWVPFEVANLFLLAAFGGLHVVFGLMIARQYGG